MAIAGSLKQPTRMAGLKTDLTPSCLAPGHPYSVLLPVGFTLPATSPPPRCALTAPFHPCCHVSPLRAGHASAGTVRFGGLLSVALSLGSPPAAVSRHRVSMEPGLSSTDRGGKGFPMTARPTATVRPAGARHIRRLPALPSSEPDDSLILPARRFATLVLGSRISAARGRMPRRRNR